MPSEKRPQEAISDGFERELKTIYDALGDVVKVAPSGDAVQDLRNLGEQRDVLRQTLVELLPAARGNPYVLDKIHAALDWRPGEPTERKGPRG